MNELLGKTAKAMYKLSGKTLQQLSDETGKTVDCINNLFYARIQKPDVFGVASFVEATGYTMDQLMGFLKQAKKIPAGADFTAEFTKYIDFVSEAGDIANHTVSNQDEAMTEKLHESYREQINQMQNSFDRLKKHYDHSVDQINRIHAEATERQDREIHRLRTERIILLAIAFGMSVATVIFGCLYFL